MPNAHYEAAKAKYREKFKQLPMPQLLNQVDSTDLLHYLNAKKALHDEALQRHLGPLHDEASILKARQDLNNLRQGGSPQAASDMWHKTAGYYEGKPLPMNPDGTVNMVETLKGIQESVHAEEQRKLDREMRMGATEQTTTTVEPSGQKTVTGQMMTKEGKPVSGVRTVSSEAPNAPKAIDDLVQQKDKKNHERGLDTALGALRVARNVLSKPNPSNAEDGLLIDSFLKAANPSAVIRPSMIDFVQKQTPFAEQLKKKLDYYTTLPNKDSLPSGAILTENDRRQMAAAFQQYNQAMTEDSRDHYKFMKRRAEKQNLGNDLDEIFSDEELNVIEGKNFVDIPNRDAVVKGAAAAPTPAAPAATPGAAPAPQAGAGAALVKSIPVVNSPAEAPEDAEFYMSPDGRKFVNRKYKAPSAEPSVLPSETP